MNEQLQKILRGRLTPCPREIQFFDGEFARLNHVKFLLRGPEKAAGHIAENAFKEWWNITPELSLLPENSQVRPDGYHLKTSERQIEIEYADLNGLRNALRTLRQIAEPERGRTISGYLVPQMQIKDYPAASFRGIHLCLFPETEMIEVEKMIRLAAYFKLNYVILESFGVYPFECEPDFCWPDTRFSRDDFRRLVQLGKTLGVTLCPALNLVGHAPWALGSKSGKFAVLNFHPEYAPLYEPDGWCWCFSNPETRKILARFINELCDVFDNPPYFHVGCDEAESMACCSVCAQSETYRLLRDHLLAFHDQLSKRNVRMMLWHDMLVAREDPRWAGFMASGLACHGTAELYKELPRDIVICDWEYERVIPEDRDFRVAQFFSQNGFDALLCSWRDVPVTVRMGKSVRLNHFFGMLGTTWMQAFGRGLQEIFHPLAHACWNPDFDFSQNIDNMPVFNMHLRDIDLDAKIRSYEHFGRINHYQRPPDNTYSRKE